MALSNDAGPPRCPIASVDAPRAEVLLDLREKFEWQHPALWLFFTLTDRANRATARWFLHWVRLGLLRTPVTSRPAATIGRTALAALRLHERRAALSHGARV